MISLVWGCDGWVLCDGTGHAGGDGGRHGHPDRCDRPPPPLVPNHTKRSPSRASLPVPLLAFPSSNTRLAAGDEPPARFTVATPKAGDTVAVGGDRDRTTFDVKSPSGISRAVIGRAGDARPKAVVVRLHLKGLEQLKVSAGAAAVGAVAGVRDGRVEARQWQPGKDETPLAPDDPRRLAIRVFDKGGKAATRVPPDGGHFEVTFPATFFRDNPRSLTVEWVDFYR